MYMKGIIYKYTNKLNNRVYIGQTINEKLRKESHFKSGANCKFHRAIHYYGWMNFEYEVIEVVDKSKLSERELYWINYYDSVNNGYNSKTRSCVDALEKKEQLILNNLWPFSLPYGYEHRNKDGNVYINEDQANIIKNIYNDYVNGLSYSDIKKKYNITPSNILRNNTYIGNEIFPQIVTKEIFDKVQSLLSNYRHKKRKRIEVVIKGIKYNSIEDAAEKLGYKHPISVYNLMRIEKNKTN